MRLDALHNVPHSDLMARRDQAVVRAVPVCRGRQRCPQSVSRWIVSAPWLDLGDDLIIQLSGAPECFSARCVAMTDGGCQDQLVCGKAVTTESRRCSLVGRKAALRASLGITTRGRRSQ